MKLRRFLMPVLAAVALCVGAATESSSAWSKQADASEARSEILVLVRLSPEHFRLGTEYGGSYGGVAANAMRRKLAKRIARNYGLELVTDWPMPLVGLDCFVMAVPDNLTVEEAVKRVSADPGVDFAQPMNVFRAQGRPAAYNDPLFRAQPDSQAWHLADLHEIATGRGVTIAVVDSGIETDHPDLAGQVVDDENFVDDHPAVAEQHGTGVAGIIAAKAGNGIGIVGVAPGAHLMGLRACWQDVDHSAVSATTECTSLSLAKALHFAIEHDAQIINLSLSGPPDPLLGTLLDVAVAHGTTIVAAYDGQLPHGGFPASHPGVTAVSDESLVDDVGGVYTAPGRDIPTTQPGGKWYLVDGSSYAAAHVTGLFALLRERRSPNQGAVTLVATGANGGTIDACATLLHVSEPCDCACPLATRVTANGDP